MRVVIRSWRQGRCRHRVTVTVRSMGMDRSVCERCGHVTFSYPESGEPLQAEMDRGVFARPGDLIEDPPPGRHQTDG
jgi:hypothetical protein